MRYLLRFIGACIIAICKPSFHFLSNVLLFIWHGCLPDLSSKEMIKLEWQSSYFYCSYQMNGCVSPYYVYKTFKDFVVGKRQYVDRKHKTVFEHENAANML